MGRLYSSSFEAPASRGWSQHSISRSLDHRYAHDLLNTSTALDGRLRTRPFINAAAGTNTKIDHNGVAQQVAAGGWLNVTSALTGLFEHPQAFGGATDISGTVTSPANSWRLAGFKNNVIGAKSGQGLIRRATAGAGNFEQIPLASGAGPVPTGGVMITAYGRVWAVKSPTEQDVIFYSDLLIEDVWNNGLGAGVLDLRTVWGHDADVVTALAAYNGLLVIFGKRHVVIYQDAMTPSTMTLKDQIVGAGCVATDTVQLVANDLIFLDATGVMSLARLIKSDTSAPISSLSEHVSDFVAYELTQTDAAGTTLDGWWSAFDRKQQLYLIGRRGRGTFIVGSTLALASEDPYVAWHRWQHVVSGADVVINGAYTTPDGAVAILTA